MAEEDKGTVYTGWLKAVLTSCVYVRRSRYSVHTGVTVVEDKGTVFPSDTGGPGFKSHRSVHTWLKAVLTEEDQGTVYTTSRWHTRVTVEMAEEDKGTVYTPG